MIENITDGLIAGAKRSVREKNEEGYILLYPEPETFDGVEVLLMYYVKQSDYPLFSFYLEDDCERRVYCFSYIYNKETDELITGMAVKLSQKASRRVIAEWFRMMDVKLTALEVIEECLKH